MTRILQIALAAMLATTPILASVPAEAKGCIKGAIVGGLAGHMMHHGVLGAVGGCAVGHHLANRRTRRDYPTDSDRYDRGGYNRSNPNYDRGYSDNNGYDSRGYR